MSIFFRTIGLLAICCLLRLPVQGAEQGSAGRIEQARTFIEQLDRGEASKAVREFDAVMAKALSAERLQALWVCRPATGRTCGVISPPRPPERSHSPC